MLPREALNKVIPGLYPMRSLRSRGRLRNDTIWVIQKLSGIFPPVAMLKALLLIFPAMLLANHAQADKALQDILSLQALANEKNLAQSAQWLNLLHYNRGGTLHSRNQSYVVSKDFFLSDKGKTNPQAELDANIRAFFAQDIEQRCRFPARFHWLFDQLSEKLEQASYLQGLSHCELLLEVQEKIPDKKLVLVFPSAYMGSASSIFGHTLFRIDSGEKDESVILNWAINYGAKLEQHDNALEYAYKGIFGLYKGQYFVVPYAQKIKEYGQMENRDIWEYPLALNENEVTFLTEHLWELQDVDFDYYFFDENCSYRLLELLEVARPELNLTSRLRLTEIPINTVKLLHENNLIEDSVFRASKERILKHKIAQLGKTDIAQMQDFVELELALRQSLAQTHYQQASSEKKMRMLESAYDYLRFQQSQKERDSAMAKRSLNLLKEMNQVSQHLHPPLKEVEVPMGESIFDSHDSQRLAIGGGRILDKHNIASIEYRMAYHDLLDNRKAYPEGAHIEGPGIRLQYTDNDYFIESWKLVDIMSLNPLSKIQKDFSWNISIEGLRQQEGNSQLSTLFQAGGGYTWQYKNILHYQLVSPRIENNPAYENNTKAGIHYQLGFLYNPKAHSTQLELQVIKLEQQETKYLAEFTQQLELSRDHALRFTASYFEQDNNLMFDKNKTLMLSYLFYF